MMKVGLKYWRYCVVLIAVAMALLETPTAFAWNTEPHVLPPSSHPFGRTYGEWSNAWWQWAFSIPTPVNPLLDTTGAHCSEGQSGPVWFLAGPLTSGSVTRHCTIPAGKALFFPIVNAIASNTGNRCGPDVPVPQLRKELNAFIATITSLKAQLDGENINNLQSLRVGANNPTFNITLPQNNITSLICPHELAPGTYGPSVSGGFYVMLAPLPAGSHTLHFKGAAGSLTVDVTYHLTIQPGEEEN